MLAVVPPASCGNWARAYRWVLILLAACCCVSGSAPYTNPVIAHDFPDPAIVRVPNGFVAYSTRHNVTHVPCATSPDLVHWTAHGDALPVLPPWASPSALRVCAPDVSEHDGIFYLYFLSWRHDNRTNCIGGATSRSATGPFVASQEPIVCDEAGKWAAMDPRAFDDARGTPHLYWGSHGTPITLGQLDATRLALAPGVPPVSVLGVDASPYGALVEAPWVYVDGAGALTMLFSGNQCCGPHGHYSVSAARSRSGDVRGPWEKFSGEGGPTILTSSARVTAPGHGAVIRDDAGADWLLYHANDGPQCNASYCTRALFLDRLYYNATGAAGRGSDWPWTGGPSHTPQVAPVVTGSP